MFDNLTIELHKWETYSRTCSIMTVTKLWYRKKYNDELIMLILLKDETILFKIFMKNYLKTEEDMFL